MDTRRVKRLRTYLTAHFSLIAFLTSTLASNSGSEDYFFPVLVLLVVVSSLLLVDILEVFYLGRIGSYVGMSIASIIALCTLGFSIFYEASEEVQFVAVASLLIYPQCVLFFQKKTLRVFEQLAIFLLLQMIVAALINDNIVYGFLLAPIVILWVSSLFLVSRYATLVEITPSIEEPVPLFYELVYQKLMRTVMRSGSPAPSVQVRPLIESSILSSRKKRSLLLAVPLAVSALGFSGILYFMLPRVETSAVMGWELKQVGLPDQITTGDFGNFLMDPTPVMRLKLVDSSDRPYQPIEPPYLRSVVLDRYIPPRSVYQPGHWVYQAPSRPVQTYSYRGAAKGRDSVRVEVALKKDFRKCVVCVPPISKMPTQMSYKPVEMVFLESDENKEHKKRKVLSYQFDTAGFVQRRQLPILSDWDQNEPHDNYLNIPELPLADLKRLEILERSGVSGQEPYLVAKQLEYHLSESGEYSYTLSLPRPMNEDIDPIEDFLVNQKTGLCQNYASAMVTMLRQSGIPSRIVIGFVPVDWNRLGQHFIVRKSDAHAWVEARFSREELSRTEHATWLDGAENYWVRFDPTPSADDSDRGIIESSQSLEYAEKLWEDYVSNADKIDQAGLYQGVNFSGTNMVDVLKENVRLLTIGISEGLFRGRNISFAWPLALAIFLIGAVAVGLWQVAVWLPKVAPNLARKLGIMRRKRAMVHQAFFAQCIGLLESLKIYRDESETMQEYNDRAQENIGQTHGETLASELEDSMSLLRGWYHRMRFGAGTTVNAEAQRQIELHLKKMERAIRMARDS